MAHNSFTPSSPPCSPCNDTHNTHLELVSFDARGFASYCQCSICLDVLYEPVSLACGHTYCALCLTKVNDKRCPQCRRAWFEWPATNIFIWELIQRELADQVERRREEFKRQCSEGVKEKKWTTLAVTEAPVVIDFSRCRQKEEEHKQRVRESARQQRSEGQGFVALPTQNLGHTSARPSALIFADF